MNQTEQREKELIVQALDNLTKTVINHNDDINQIKRDIALIKKLLLEK